MRTKWVIYEVLGQLDIIIAKMSSIKDLYEVLREPLQLMSHQHQKEDANKLQSFVAHLAYHPHLLAALTEAIETVPLPESDQRQVCLLLVKALEMSQCSSQQVYCIMRLLLNWNLHSSSRKLLQNGLRFIINNADEDEIAVLENILNCLQTAIAEIAAESHLTLYESPPIKIGVNQVRVTVQVPQQLAPLIESYLLFLEHSIDHIMEEMGPEAARQSQRCLKDIHGLIFFPQNILEHTDMFLALISFYNQLQGMTTGEDSDKMKQMFVNVAAKMMPQVNEHIKMIYNALSFPSDPSNCDLLNLEQAKVTSNICQKVLTLKAETSTFHRSILKALLQTQHHKLILGQVKELLPCFFATIKGYIAEHRTSCEQTNFINNVLSMLLDYLTYEETSPQLHVSLLLNYALPLTQYALQEAQNNVQTGKQLYQTMQVFGDCILEDHLLGTLAPLLTLLFKKEEFMSQFVGQWAAFTLKQAYLALKGETLSLEETEYAKLGLFDIRTMFMVLCLLLEHCSSSFQPCWSVIQKCIALEAMHQLTAQELPYFYFFLQQLVKTLPLTPQALSAFSSALTFCLAQTQNQTAYFSYSALAFVQALFFQASSQEWTIDFMGQFIRFDQEDCIQLKWTIYESLTKELQKELSEEVLVYMVKVMKAGTYKQLQRAIHMKKIQRKVEYGQLNKYIGSCRPIVRPSLLQDKPRLLEELLDFVCLMQMAAVVRCQSQLLLTAIGLHPFLLKHVPSQDTQRAALCLMEKTMFVFMNRGYQGTLHIRVIMLYMMLVDKQQNSIVVQALLAFIRYALRPYCHNHHKMTTKSVEELINVLALLQQYLLLFGLAPQEQLEEYWECRPILQVFKTDPNPIFEKLFSQMQVIDVTIAQLQDKDINYARIVQFSTQHCYKEYDAFVLLSVLSINIQQRQQYDLYLILQIAYNLLLYSPQWSTSAFQKQNKSINKPQQQLKDGPFDFLHRQTYAYLFKKTLFEQIYALFLALEVTDQTTCHLILPLFSLDKFTHIMEGALSQIKKRENQLILQHMKTAFKIEREEHEKKSRRTISRVVGDRVQPQQVTIVSQTGKRCYNNVKGKQQASYAPLEHQLLSKVIIDNDKREHRSTGIQEETEIQVPIAKVKPEYSWSALCGSLSKMNLSPASRQ